MTAEQRGDDTLRSSLIILKKQKIPYNDDSDDSFLEKRNKRTFFNALIPKKNKK